MSRRLSYSSETIVLIRHGETEWNRENRYQGQIDVPLSAVGRSQAEATGDAVQGIRFAAGYASDLSRAADTARIIGEKVGVEFEFVSSIREASKGELEGLCRTVAHDARTPADAALMSADINSRPPGGESLHDLYVRCRMFVEDIDSRCESSDSGPIVVVAHAGSLRMLASVLLELPIEASLSFHFDNCGITAIERHRNRKPLLIAHNDLNHLLPVAIADR